MGAGHTFLYIRGIFWQQVIEGITTALHDETISASLSSIFV